MTPAERDNALVFGLGTAALGATLIWLARRMFTRPFETWEPIAKRLGEEHLPEWMRPSRADRSYFIRRNAIGVGFFGVLLVVIGVGSLVAAARW